MPVNDLATGRRPVFIDGRRFVIRRIPVVAVVSILELFPREIQLAWTLSKGMPAALQADRVGYTMSLLGTAADSRWIEVLTAFVEGDGDPLDWPIAKLIDQVAALSDLSRIVAALRLEEIFSGELVLEDEDVSSIERDIVDLAQQFHLSPHDVMGWSFEEYLRTVEVLLARLGEKRSGFNMVSSTSSVIPDWMTPDNGSLVS